MANDNLPAGTKSNYGLLHTKLMPPRLHSGLLQRESLFDRLDQALKKKLTFVIAPTSFGKSTLVSTWISARSVPSAWVTLDENDNDPVRLWTYVISALRNFDATLGKTSLAALSTSQPPAYQAFLIPLINDLAQLTKPCVLVLEDYHLITSTEVNAGFAFLLQNLIDTLHLVFLSRSQPDLPLAILRARDELVEFDAADLRFSAEETQAFLQNAIQSDLPGGAADQLQERTEGWPAGLRLAALALNNQKGQSGLEDVLQSFSGSHPYVADYLTQEVFKNQPATIQAFLLRTCFLSRMNASLCETVSGLSESAGLLEKLARESLFLVPLEKSGHQTWYRYNPLFAESIQYLARQRLDAAEIAVLFENASAWYENHLDYENAVEAALAARLYPRALTLIEKYIDIHSIAAVLTLKRWFSSIPEQFILAQPEASFTYAQVILFTGERYAPDMVTRLEPNLNAAEKCWEKENNRARLGAARSLRGITAWWQGDIAKACRLAQQSLDELPETDIFWRGNSLLISAFGDLNSDDIFAAQDTILEARALLGAANNIYGVLAATQILSAADYWLGELEQARQLNNQIIAEAVGSEDMLDDQGIARLSLADISYEENDLSTAEKYLQEALDLAIQRKNELLIAQVTGRLAHLQLARGKPAQAVELIKTQAARLQNPNALREVDIALAEITAHTITPGEAAGLSQEARPRTSNLLFLEQERLTFVQARKLIYTGMNLEALKLLAGRPADAAKHGRIRNQVEALCLEALAYQAAGQPENARAALTQALAVGQAKGFVRLFIDEGAEMANLLKQAIPTFSRRALAMYATTLLQAFPSEVGAVPPGVPGLIEPLSQQELRVLRYLAAGLSNAEIGQELIVSTNTVKTHVKNIYRKLNVSTRGEARQVAHELKLI